jgi:microcystin-dependent protein
MWLSDTPPTGWLICDGSDYDIAQYSELNQFLMTCYGTNSGKLPDFRGLYPAGAGAGDPSRGGHALTKGGQAKANAYHAQRTAQPTNPFVAADDGEHRHRMGNTGTVNGSSSEGRFYPDTNGSKWTSYAGVHTHAITGGDNVTRPPTLAIHFIIKTYA